MNSAPVITDQVSVLQPEAAADTPQEETYVILLGQEGADIWQKHFAPSKDSKEVIQVPIEWVNFLSVALLTPNKFDWAKQFITSNAWTYIYCTRN